MALTREQIEQYLNGQGHPHPDADGTLDEFIYGGERQAMYDEAVLNNYALPDVDRWFHLVKVMGIDLPFDAAIKIDGALHEANLETMELSLPEERFGLDAYGRGVFKGSYEEVKEQVKADVVQKEGFTAGDLCKIQVPGLTLDDAFQLYAELRFQADGLRTLLFGNRDEVWDISGPENERLLPYELDQIVEPFLQKESPLYQFIDQEVPFRMREVLGIEISDRHCLDLAEAVKENLDVMFDYDRFSDFLMNKYEELLGLDKEHLASIRGEISNLRHELDWAAQYAPDQEEVIAKRLVNLSNELDAAFGMKPRIFIFDDELTLANDNVTIEGYVWAVDALVDRLPSSEDMENINFFPEYNVETGDVKLTAIYDTPIADGELNKSWEVTLTDDEKVKLVSAMEDYCKELCGVSCLDFVNEIRHREGLSPLRKDIAQDSLESLIFAAETKNIDEGLPGEAPRSVELFDGNR